MKALNKCSIVLVGLTALGGSANALPTHEVLGNLTCSLGESVATESGSTRARKVLCVFGSPQSGLVELYEGTVYFASTGLAATERSMSWVVKGPPKPEPASGRLEQAYTPQSGFDDSKNGALVGKEVKGIKLHPLALEEAADKADRPSRASAIDLKLITTTT